MLMTVLTSGPGEPNLSSNPLSEAGFSIVQVIRAPSGADAEDSLKNSSVALRYQTIIRISRPVPKRVSDVPIMLKPQAA